jgi:hypothetical protein
VKGSSLRSGGAALAAVVAGLASLALAPPALADHAIVSGPTGSVSSKTARFTFTGPRRTTFRCRLDRGPFQRCTSPKRYRRLSEGRHTFALTNSAHPGRGEVVRRTWIVDTVRPSPPAITSGPGGLLNSTAAALRFTGERRATMTCRLTPRNSRFAACTSPRRYAALVDGSYRFAVRQRDRAGNESRAATRTWTVDTVAPAAPAITAGPSGTVFATDATFAFSGSPGDVHRCSLDGSAPADCTSPTSYAALSVGAHTFSVVQVDEAANASAPATRTWAIASREATVHSVGVGCSGDIVVADVIAFGPIGSGFTITLYRSSGGSPYTSTGQSAGFEIPNIGAQHFRHNFDVSALPAGSYKAISSGGVESGTINAPCGPGTEIPDAPAALLLPLSLLGTLGLAGAVLLRRSPRRRRA